MTKEKVRLQVLFESAYSVFEFGMLVASGKEYLSKVPSYLTLLYTCSLSPGFLVYRILFYNTRIVRNHADRGADDLVHGFKFPFRLRRCGLRGDAALS